MWEGYPNKEDWWFVIGSAVHSSFLGMIPWLFCDITSCLQSLPPLDALHDILIPLDSHPDSHLALIHKSFIFVPLHEEQESHRFLFLQLNFDYSELSMRPESDQGISSYLAEGSRQMRLAGLLRSLHLVYDSIMRAVSSRLCAVTKLNWPEGMLGCTS